MKRKANALFKSLISLILCFSMLVGTTFAWFTDSVKSGINTIAAGNLDVELYHTNAAVTDERVNSETKLFMDLQGNPILWEPGVVSYENLRVANEGDLALAYQLAINTANENFILDPANNTQYGLSQILKVGVVEGGITATDRAGVVAAVKETDWTTLATFLRSGSLLPVDGQNQQTWGVVIYWQPGEDDNRWNLNNGKVLSEGETLQIDLGVKLVATQEVYESDAFGDNYDTEAKAFAFPNFVGGSASAAVVPNDQGQTTAAVTMDAGVVSATVPAGAQLAAGVTKLTLNVSMLGASGSNITLGEDEAMRSLDVHVDGLAENNTVPVTVTLKEAAPKGLNMGNYKVYHVEKDGTKEMTLVDASADFTAHNQFKYDPATGDVTLYMATFSEVTCVIDTLAAWNGEFDYDWYNADAEVLTIANADQLAAFGAIVGGMNGQTKDSFANKTVKLIADINLGDGEKENNPDIIFYPIGYNSSDGKYEKTGEAITSSLKNFEGTFDGNGHTVANFYQNTWEMKGDNNYYDATLQYYRDGMGLFGRIYGGTIKNLTVKNFKSDGEYTTTGVIAAYADCGATFENIAITNCNPRVYNIGNGGIVGCVGWYTKDKTDKKVTFNNITVDNSNKISALWGSYDVACGGIVGQYYPTSGQSAANYPANAGIHMENCHVAAQLDVYNDVCGNYQYYAYRYAGMMIGSIRENEIVNGKTVPKMDKITAENCTVNYGNWNGYYYCELVANSLASYTHDHQFSRLDQIADINLTDMEYLPMNTTKWEKIPTSGRVNYVIVTGERTTENAKCYHFVDGQEHDHNDYNGDGKEDFETVNGESVYVENNRHIYLPFYQLYTGYGWGVSSIGLKEYSGIVTDLGIKEDNYQGSDEKFDFIGTDEYAEGKTINISALFVGKSQSIKDNQVQVFVSPADKDSTVTANYVPAGDGKDWYEGTLTFSGKGKATITITDYYFCTPTTITVTVTERTAEEKFDIVMNNGDFLHRVGNDGTVALDKLFKAKDGVKVGTVSVTVEAVDGTAASGTYSNNAIQFSGTGVVKVTVTDNDYCIPAELMLEVVDATNVTSATSATDKNIVLLNDCGFGSLEVSGGYTLYGNGFTMTCGSDSAALDMGYAFVTLNNGTLDNVQIDCPNFDYAVLYKSNMTESGNRSEKTDKTRYYNVKSGVMVSGNSQILNSRISGGRAAVNVSGGNVIIDNSRIERGAVASILVGAANNLTLRDVTLVQKPTASTYDPNKTLMGFSVLFVCDENGNAAPVTLEGKLIQNAWVDENDKQYVPSAGQSIISTVLGKTEYLHDLDGDGTKESLNLGFAYMPESLTSKVNTTTITDNRTNKNAVPYDYAEISILNGKTYVYSYKNSNGTADAFKNEDSYEPNKYSDIITVAYSDTSDGLTTGKSLGTDGKWVYELNVDLDQLSGYALDFSKLSMTVNGVSVTDFKVNGSAKPTSPVAVTAGGVTYTLTTTVNGKEYTAIYKVTGTETSKESPSLVAANYEAGLCVASSKGGTWHGAAPALKGIQIKYWSVAEKQYKTINLADYTPTTKGQLNGTNTTWTYSPTNGDFTLTLTGGQVHSSNKVNAMPVCVENNGGYTLYFVAAKSTGLVNSGNSARTIPVTYTFKDNNNGDVLTFSHTWSVAENKDAQYKYSDFCNGTLTKLEGNSGGINPCVTADTLVTLADGTRKRIDEISYEDKLLVWNFFEGKYDVSKPAIIFDHGADNNTVIKLKFSDGTEVKVVNMHQFFDADLKKLVTINAENVASYVGHKFTKLNGRSNSNVKLVDYTITQEYVEAWGVMSAGHYNIITEGMLSADFDIKDVELFNYFEVGKDMRFDQKKMQADIAKYGLYTYKDFADYLTYEQFVAFNVQYFKIPVAKGLYTYEGILDLIEQYLN